MPNSVKIVLALLAFATAARAVDTNANLAYFEKHVRPLLAAQCYQCHSEENSQANLRLDTRAGWLHGGASGKPAIVPGKPDTSPLVQHLSTADPTEGHSLKPSDLATLTRWVKMGAPDPRSGDTTNRTEIDIDAGRKFWSFQPIKNPAPPQVADTAWPRNDIDRFVLARLEAAGLTPSPDATPETLTRRLHFDLTGLPPAFFDGGQSVDDLLASPQFGERWGRHWLDVARYAESSGGGRALLFPDAWRYRDYVVDAFNRDLPFDQFVRQQLAGDLLPHKTPKQRADNLTATAFLAIGTTNFELQDKQLLDMDVIDEQIDTLSKTFLGMTLGCARCHDHKFDPIPTSDYYALAGIFKSTNFIVHSNVSKWTSANLPLPNPGAEEEQATLEVAHKKVADRLNAEIKTADDQLKKLGKPSGAAGATDPRSLPGIVIDDTAAEITGNWMLSTHNQRWVGAGYLHDLGQAKGEKSITFTPDLPATGEYEIRIAYSPGTNRPQNVPVTISYPGGAKTVHVDQRKTPPIDNLFRRIGTFTLPAGTFTAVTISNEDTTGSVIADAVQFLATGTPPTPQAPPAPDPDAARVAALTADLEMLRNDLKAHQKNAPPARPKTMAVSEGAKPADTHICVRGVVHNRGPVVPRGFLQVATHPDTTTNIPDGQSGRLQLAGWIASPHNPLTARVLANRIWLHLVGEGLVRTPDNLGAMGRKPSHPQLLDHLAHRLVHTHHWSVKSLVRDIVGSRTYRLSSTPSPQHLAADPDNRLLSHAHRRRLDAEAIRDAALVVAGQLDPTIGGATIKAGTRSEFGYKFDSPRRSLYLPVFRNHLPDLFSVFDFADPNIPVGKRTPSAVPTQALFMMNSPFVHTQAKHAAAQLLASAESTDHDLVTRAYQLTLHRTPTKNELALATRFLQTTRDAGKPQLDAIAALFHSLFASLDFRYLD